MKYMRVREFELILKIYLPVDQGRADRLKFPANMKIKGLSSMARSLWIILKDLPFPTLLVLVRKPSSNVMLRSFAQSLLR